MSQTPEAISEPDTWFTPDNTNPYLAEARRFVMLRRTYLMQYSVIYFAEYPDGRIVHEYLSHDLPDDEPRWRSRIKTNITKRTFEKYLKRFAAFDFERLNQPVDLGPESFIMSESTDDISIKTEPEGDYERYFLDITAEASLRRTEEEKYNEFLKLHFLFCTFNRRRIHFEETRFGGGGEV